VITLRTNNSLSALALSTICFVRGCEVDPATANDTTISQPTPLVAVDPDASNLDTELNSLWQSRDTDSWQCIIRLARHDDEKTRDKAHKALAHTLSHPENLSSAELAEFAAAFMSDVDGTGRRPDLPSSRKNQQSLLNFPHSIPTLTLISALTENQLEPDQQEPLVRMAYHCDAGGTAMALYLNQSDRFTLERGLREFSMRGAAVCAELAGIMQDRTCYDAIIAPLRDPDAPFEESSLRHSCVWALGRLGATTDELKELLTQTLSDASVQVGREAVISLRLLFENEALPDLAHFLEESSVDSVNEQILDFLADLSPNEIRVYRESLEAFSRSSVSRLDWDHHFQADIRRNLTTVFGLLESIECAVALEKHRRDSSPD
jgi:hypothetical protein